MDKDFWKPNCELEIIENLEQNETNLLHIAFSKTFPMKGRQEIGRKFDGSDGSPFLSIGVILASFNLLGNFPVRKEILIKSVKGDTS